MELVIVIIVIGAVLVTIFRKFSSLVYYLVAVDILLRMLTFIKIKFQIKELTNFLDAYIPSNLISIFDKYTSGIFNDVLVVGYIVVVLIFEFYIIKTLIKKK